MNLGSTWGQPGVNLGSTWGEAAAPYGGHGVHEGGEGAAQHVEEGVADGVPLRPAQRRVLQDVRHPRAPGFTISTTAVFGQLTISTRAPVFGQLTISTTALFGQLTMSTTVE